MINANFFLGYPITFKKGIEIYPPKVGEVVKPNSKFNLYKNILTITQEEIDDEIVGDPNNYNDLRGDEVFPTPLERLLSSAYHNTQNRIIIKEAFEFFLHQKVDFLYEQKKIVVGGSMSEIVNSISSLDDLIYIDGEEEYFIFQNCLREALGDDPVEKPPDYEDPRVRRIKAKGRYRDKIAAKAKGSLTFDSSLVGICCMGYGITPLNIEQVTVAAVKYLTRAYQKKDRYEIDVRSLQAGADPQKVKPEYWLNILNKND